MALFAVIALKDSASVVDETVGRLYPNVSYKIENGKWIINADSVTAKQVSTHLGIRDTQAHLIISIRGYSGRANPDLWEWLAALSEKADA